MWTLRQAQCHRESLTMQTRGRLISLLAGVMSLSGGTAAARPVIAPVFDTANFTDPVQNPFFPLVPGTTYFYEASAPEGLYRTEVTVTSGTKVIEGIPAVVVHDIVWLDVAGGPTVLIEDTFDWYAADNDGNVWYLGESTVEYLYDENWNQAGTSTEGSWEAGLNDAQPGFIMPADPRPGLAYRQEFAAGTAEDLAKIERLNAKVSVPYGTFSNALVTKEWTRLEPGAVERKYYVAGIGLVLTRELHGQRTLREELVAVSTGP
jgi:hypothetical protein